jgi:hypothetical protein
MSPKTLTLVLATTAVAGCTLHRSDVREDGLLPPLGGAGKVIQPKVCALRVATLSRPLRDDSINGAVWSVADEQMIAPLARRALEANGLRIGLITGDLPAAVEAVLKAPPPHKVDPAQVVLPDGENSLISTNAPLPQASLLLSLGTTAEGRDYKEASGFFRVTAHQEGAHGVVLRLVPEIHHGPFQNTFGAVPNPGPLTPKEFTIHKGQKEETLGDLAVTLTLEPNQVAVIGCRAESARSLGSFLFTQTEANSDRLAQKLLLIWASRTNLGEPAGARPKALPDLEPIDPPDTSTKAAWWRKGKDASR